MKRLNLLLICLILALGLAVTARAEGGQLTLNADFEEKTFALAPIVTEDGLPRIQDSTLISASIQNYNGLVSTFGGSPSWSVRQTAGAEQISFYVGDYGGGYYVWMDGTPDAAGDYAFELTCQWGGQTATAETVIHFVEKNLPTDTDVPGRIDMQVGEITPLDFHFLTGEWNGTGETRIAYLVSGAGQYVESDWSSGSLGLRATQPGIAQIELAVYDDTYNVAIWEKVIIFVADENGNVPGMILSDSEIERTYAIAPVNAGYGVPHMYNSYLAYTSIWNYGLMSSFCDGSPVWNVTQTEGEEIQCRVDAWYNHFYLYPEEFPSQECDVAFEITCEWGGFSATSTATIHFVNVDLPTGSTIPDTLDMQIGETVTLDCNFVPAGWSSNPRMSVGYSSYEVLSYVRIDWPGDGTATLTALKAGITQLNIELYDTDLNVSIRKNVKVRIADENGNVPEPELTVQVSNGEEWTWALAPSYADEGMARRRTSELINAHISDYNGMSSLCEGSPAWSVTQTGGEALELYSSGNDGEWYYVYADEAPTAAGDYTFELTCEWGGKTATKTITIHYVDMELPTGSTVPSTLNMQVGERQTLDYDFVPAGWGGSSMLSVGGINNTWEFLKDDWPGDGTVGLTALKAGIAQIRIGVFNSDLNVIVWQTITVRIADENGVVPEPEMSLYVSNGEEKTWALAPSYGEEGTVRRYTSTLINVNISNYSAIAPTYEGSPVWSVRQTSGATLPIRDNSDGRWYYVYADSVPSAAGDYTFEVTCEWGGKTATKTVTLHYVDMELPTGSTIPSTLDMQIGETVTLDYDFVPAGWCSSPQLSVGYNGDEVLDYVRIDWPGNGTATLTAVQAGITQIFVNVYDYARNVSVSRSVAVRIADENGVVPEPELTLQIAGGEERTWALTPGYPQNGKAGRRTSDLIEASIVNYDSMAAICGGSPVWSLKQTSGAELTINSSRYNSWFDAYTNEAVTVAGDYTFEVTCEWGGKTATGTVTIHYVDMELPTGSTIPDTLDMQVGERQTLDYDFVPAGWSGSPEMEVSGNSEMWTLLGTDRSDDGKLQLVARQPGIAQANVWVYDYSLNVAVRKAVTVRIADENGVVPEPELSLRVNGGEEKTWALTPGSAHDGQVGSYTSDLINADIANYNAMSEICEGSPVWSVRQTGGNALRINSNSQYSWFDAYLNEAVTVAGDYTFEVTCEWGAKTATKTVTIHYVDMELPTGSTIPDTLDMQIGERQTLDYDFVPADWSDMSEVDVGGINNTWEFLRNDWPGDGTVGLTALKPGTTQLNVWVYDYSLNVAVRKTVTVRIADENGVVPEPELNLRVNGGEEKTWALAPSNAVEGMAYRYTPSLINAYISDYEGLSSIYEGSPVWSVTQTSGETLALRINDNGERYNVYSDEAPTAAGDYTFEVTCEWGGKSATKTVTIHYVDMELPTGSTIPDTLDMQIGETVTLDYDFIPAGWSGAPQITLGGYGNTWEMLNDGRDNNNKRTLTAMKAGVTQVNVGVYDYDLNVVVRKTVTVNVTSGNVEPDYTELRLPSALKEIEAEAFAGISANVIIIPSGCTSIGSRAFAGCSGLVKVYIPGNVAIADDAFAGCGDFTIYTDSDAVAAWAQAHGIQCAVRE